MPYSSSPLNPHRSSSPPPMSSPTPAAHSALPLSFAPQAGPSRLPRPAFPPATPPLSARYARVASSSSARRRPTAPPTSVQSPSPTLATGDLFSEGTTPTQGAMWRERLHRRIKDRERRKRSREDDLARRRGTEINADDDEDALEAQAQADDEEIFRRLMVLQRRREQHAALVSLETETGGSDPNLPEFWEEDLDSLTREEMALYRQLEEGEDADQDQWAAEAAEAEAAERWAEEAAVPPSEELDMAMDEDAFDEHDWAAIDALTASDAMDMS